MPAHVREGCRRLAGASRQGNGNVPPAQSPARLPGFPKPAEPVATVHGPRRRPHENPSLQPPCRHASEKAVVDVVLPGQVGRGNGNVPRPTQRPARLPGLPKPAEPCRHRPWPKTSSRPLSLPRLSPDRNGPCLLCEGPEPADQFGRPRNLWERALGGPPRPPHQEVKAFVRGPSSSCAARTPQSQGSPSLNSKAARERPFSRGGGACL